MALCQVVNVKLMQFSHKGQLPEVHSYNSFVVWRFLFLAPERGPTVTVTKSKKNSAELTWEEIPLDSQRGFIINYTIFYKAGNTGNIWQCMCNT